MTAIARLKSENKIDKIYAFKYYFLSLFSISILGLSGFFYSEKLYFNTFVFFCFFIFFFKLKNIYSDYSKESKCKHPNTVQDFLNLINIRAENGLARFVEKDVDKDSMAIIIIMYTLLFGFLYLIVSLGVSEKTGVNVWFYLTNFFMGHAVLMALIISHSDIKNKDVNLEKIDFSLIEKTKTIEFNSVEQKDKFFNEIKYHFNLNKKMNRNQLFHIINHMKDDVNKVNIIDFFDKQVEKKTES